MSTQKETAIDTLTNLLKFGVESKGYNWNSDFDYQVKEIVESIIEATIEEINEERKKS